MKPNRILFRLGSLVFITIPLITLISCSTSWTRWKTSDNQIQEKIIFKKIKIAQSKEYQIRTSVFHDAYDASNKIINLNKINNQFEFIEVISQIIKFKPTTKNVDEFWNDLDGLNTYIDKIEKNFKFKYKYNNLQSSEIEWNIEKIINDIKHGITDYKNIENINNNKINYKKLLKDLDNFKQNNNTQQIQLTRKKLKIDPISTKKLFDIQIDGINLNTKQPNNFNGVAIAAISLLNIDSVKALLKKNSTLALDLSKLVNLPKLSFKGFASLLKHIDTFFNKILFFQNNNINKHSVFYQWYKKMNFQIMQTGVINSNQDVSDLNNLNKIKSLFLVNNLKK